MKWVSTAEQQVHKPTITMRNAKRCLEWCKARRHWTLEQWNCVLWSDVAPSGRPKDKSEFGGCQENAT